VNEKFDHAQKLLREIVSEALVAEELDLVFTLGSFHGLKAWIEDQTEKLEREIVKRTIVETNDSNVQDVG
jgi:hypothetical protein